MHKQTALRLGLAVATSVGIASAGPAGATTMLFDFGNNGRQTADLGWNNVTYPAPAPAPPLPVVVDSNGDAVPGVTLTVTDQFFINGQPSQSGSESPAGDAASYPTDATDDYFFGHTGAFAGNESTPTGGFVLDGLDQGLTYDFRFFSSRTAVNDNRETAFSVTGANTDSGVVATSNNDSQVLLIAGITPDINGEIFVEVSAGPNNDNGNGFYYINLMQVDAIPEPGTLALLCLGGATLLRRRRA